MIEKLRNFFWTVDGIGLFQGISFMIWKKLKSNRAIKLSGIRYPIHLRPCTSDEKVFWQIFVNKEYDINFGHKPQIIIDGGANIGLASIYFKNKYPDATIIAVEPDMENVTVLKLNMEQYDNIHIKCAALWSEKANVRISDKMKMGKWGVVTEALNDNNESDLEVIDTITISGIMEEYDLKFIDVLKLDIESAEKQLFSDNYMNWLPKTKVIIIELHDWMLDGCSKSFFTAINKAFNNYTYQQAGENVIIINRDISFTY